MENRTTLRWGAQEVGRLTAAPEGADTCFRAEYRLTEGLWRLYAVGRQNRLLLGCAEGGQGILQRRFSRQLTEGLERCWAEQRSRYPPRRIGVPYGPESFPDWHCRRALCAAGSGGGGIWPCPSGRTAPSR